MLLQNEEGEANQFRSFVGTASVQQDEDGQGASHGYQSIRPEYLDATSTAGPQSLLPELEKLPQRLSNSPVKALQIAGSWATRMFSILWVAAFLVQL